MLVPKIRLDREYETKDEYRLLIPLDQRIYAEVVKYSFTPCPWVDVIHFVDPVSHCYFALDFHQPNLEGFRINRLFAGYYEDGSGPSIRICLESDENWIARPVSQRGYFYMGLGSNNSIGLNACLRYPELSVEFPKTEPWKDMTLNCKVIEAMFQEALTAFETYVCSSGL